MNIKNRQVLSQYFNNTISHAEELPYISKVAEDTGVSIATISRYAKLKGFYSFPELRAKINRGITTTRVSKFNNDIINFLASSKPKTIIADDLNAVIAFHIKQRLSKYGYDIELYSFDESNVDDNREVLMMFYDDQSEKKRKVEQYIQNNKGIYITISDVTKTSNKLKVVPAKEFSNGIWSNFEINLTIRKMFDWIDGLLSATDLKKENEISMKK